MLASRLGRVRVAGELLFQRSKVDGNYIMEWLISRRTSEVTKWFTSTVIRLLHVRLWCNRRVDDWMSNRVPVVTVKTLGIWTQGYKLKIIAGIANWYWGNSGILIYEPRNSITACLTWYNRQVNHWTSNRVPVVAVKTAQGRIISERWQNGTRKILVFSVTFSHQEFTKLQKLRYEKFE